MSLASMLSIPQDAPFSELQRAWLSGYLAGLTDGNRRAPQDTGSDAPPLVVGFGSQTGNAEGLAEDIAAAAKASGLAPRVVGLDDLSIDQLVAASHLIVVTSTYGEGDMPDNAELFWEALSAPDAPRMEQLSFAVLALGDSGYDEFCHAGKLIDTKLEQLGAQRLSDRVDCDVDFEDDAAAWISTTVGVVAVAAGGTASSGGAAGGTEKPKKPSGWGRKNPYGSRVVVNRVLSGEGSAKEIRHIELDLGDSGIEYTAGDALAVVPKNSPELVEALLTAVKLDGDHCLEEDGPTAAELLASRYEIRTPSKDLITALGERTDDALIRDLIRRGDPEELKNWSWGKDVLDLATMCELRGADLIGLLRPLQHRAYSISSSALMHPDRIHLTVAAVRHENAGRSRGGVCSTYLADWSTDVITPIFLQPNNSFRVPTDGEVPIIMVGPGTGVAPFRAFLQERQASGATGRNWLFFGDQHRATDFIYEEELVGFADAGVLTKLDLAFSRDQAEKVYVQSLMEQNGDELFGWLQDGAHFYVCGDASRMAKDVDDALHRVIAQHGGLGADGAADYVADLKRAKRYVRDVY